MTSDPTIVCAWVVVKVPVTVTSLVKIGCREVCEKDVLPEERRKKEEEEEEKKKKEETSKKQDPAKKRDPSKLGGIKN